MELLINNQPIVQHDFIIVEDETSVQFDAKKTVQLFLIEVPQQLSYKTYLELNK